LDLAAIIYIRIITVTSGTLRSGDARMLPLLLLLLALQLEPEDGWAMAHHTTKLAYTGTKTYSWACSFSRI
jgi:hypothetical protein